jgi:hypothetical protein
MKNIALILSVCAIAACGAAPPDESPMQATAAIMMELRPGTPLEELLHMLDEHLVRAMAGRMEGDAVSDFRRAEAITDRLLEARLPFEWFAHEQYSLQSRLRQIQSMADRVMAMLDTGAPRDAMLTDLRLLRTEVVRLREAVAQGGTRAPPPIGRLLSGDTVGAGEVRAGSQPGAPAESAPAPPTGPRPLGAPVRPPDGR